MLITLSGKKRSGKNTAANYITGSFLKKHEMIRDFRIESNGLLSVQNRFDKPDEWFTYPENYAGDFGSAGEVRVYLFADYLKKFCIDVFGLTLQQCYGTEDDKKSLTELVWGDMPEADKVREIFEQARSEPIRPSSRMTAREVMQYFGTNIIRRMHSDAWVRATLSQIRRDGAKLALITDARFPNEVEAVINAGGKVIRLTRNVAGVDEHESEKALDSYPLDRYSGVVRNEESTIAQQNQELAAIIKDWI